MGNSIEEDIKIIESIIEEYENCSVPEVDMQVNVTFREKQNNALNHILSDYKRILKENQELKEENEYNKILLDMNNNFTIDKKTGNYKWNVIEIQKVKDKIEEIKKEKINLEIV